MIVHSYCVLTKRHCLLNVKLSFCWWENGVDSISLSEIGVFINLVYQRITKHEQIRTAYRKWRRKTWKSWSLTGMDKLELVFEHIRVFRRFLGNLEGSRTEKLEWMPGTQIDYFRILKFIKKWVFLNNNKWRAIIKHIMLFFRRVLFLQSYSPIRLNETHRRYDYTSYTPPNSHRPSSNLVRFCHNLHFFFLLQLLLWYFSENAGESYLSSDIRWRQCTYNLGRGKAFALSVRAREKRLLQYRPRD